MFFLSVEGFVAAWSELMVASPFLKRPGPLDNAFLLPDVDVFLSCLLSIGLATFSDSRRGPSEKESATRSWCRTLGFQIEGRDFSDVPIDSLIPSYFVGYKLRFLKNVIKQMLRWIQNTFAVMALR